jgi:Domain of unknown function (DUF4340)
MKKKHLLILLAVAAVVGLAGIYFQSTQYAGWSDSKTDRTIFQNLAVNDVTEIQIRSASAGVTLEKKGDVWGVAERADYPADFTKIQDLIKMLWGLKAGQEMQVGPSQLARLKLIAPGHGSESGTEINLKGDKDKDIASLIIGKSVDRSSAAADSPTTGRFVYNPVVKDRVYLVSEPFFSIEPVSVGSWLDKAFITPGEVAEMDQAPWSNNPGWKLIRKDAKAEWQLEEVQPGENLDKSFAQSLSTFAPTFTDVRPPSVSTEETGLKDPFKVSVKTFDGFTYDFLIGKGTPDKTRFLRLTVSATFPSARTPDANESADDKKKKDEEFNQKSKTLKERLEREKQFEKWVYLVPDWNLEQILKRRDEILSKTTPSPSPTAASLPESTITASPSPTGAPPPQSSPSPSAASLPESTASPSPIGSPSPQSSPSPLPGSSPSASPTSTESPSPNR